MRMVRNAKPGGAAVCIRRDMEMRYLAVFSALFLCGSLTAGAQDNKTLTVRSLAEAPSFTKRALVIGVGVYEHAGSLAPVTTNDARSFAEFLRARFGFSEEAVTLLTDAPGTPESRHPTYIHLRNAFKTLLAGVNEKSEVVVYFSGHGTRAEDHDWLVPMDGVPSDVEATCINYDEFKGRLSTASPARALLVVDACRNLSGGKDAGSSGFGAGKALNGPQFAELLSCRPKEESKIGKPEDFAESVFTHFLLRGLEGDRDAQENGVVTFDSLSQYVQGSVSQYVSSKYGESQNPDGRASLGRMVLVKAANPPAPGPAVAQRPPPPQNPERPHLGGGARRQVNTVSLTLAPGVAMEMARIPGGDFLMGFDVQTVSVQEFFFQTTPVTVAQYRAFCKEKRNGEMPLEPVYRGVHFNKDWAQEDHPIVNVTFRDAQEFCAWISGKSGRRVRLPTEQEWEKAARGVEGKRYPWGNEEPTAENADRLLWSSIGTEKTRTNPVAQFPANEFGLFDMAGNVWQWCDSIYDGEHDWRVVRGGSWNYSNAGSFRSAHRHSDSPFNQNFGIGFRCASGP